MKINCIAIDDEPLALDVMEDYIKKIPFLNLLSVFDNGLDAIEYLKSNKVDLIFLDIQMEDLTGIQLLKALKTKPEVIFTTAYDSFAVQSFELDVTDYLLKPISFERFIKSVDKVYEKLKLQNNVQDKSKEIVNVQTTKDNYCFIKTGFKIQKIDFDDILYVEGQKDYLRIITKKEKIMTLMNFKSIEDILPESDFVRIHKSYLVAIDKIEFVERNRIKIADALLPIGDMYKKTFFELLEQKKFLSH